MTNTADNKKCEQNKILSRYEPIVWLSELPMILRKTPETVRRMRKEGKLPEPDVQLSYRSTGWNLSTLRAAGLNIKLNEALSEHV